MSERRASRTPARASLGRGNAPSARSGTGRGGSNQRSAFIRGDAGMRRTDEEIERNKQRQEERRNATNKPFRFFVPVGETRQIIVCDEKPDFFLYEHALKDANGKWGRLFSGCIKEFDNCPVCKATGKESYYAMVLTVIDLTPFRTRDGDDVEFNRKLLIVKPAQQKKFLRFFNKEGTLRGALFDMTRDGDKDSSIGNDIDFVEFVPEDEMETYVREWRDRDGKEHEDLCYEPYVYEEIFEEPTMENLLALTGGEPTPGSREANDRELGGRGRGRDAPRRGRGDTDGWEDGDDNRSYGGGGRSRGGRGGQRDDRDDDDQDSDDGRAERTRRGRSDDRGEPEPSPRRSARGRARDDDHQEDEAPRRPARGRDAEAEDPPTRGSRRSRGGDDGGDDQGGADDTPSRATRTRRAPAAAADDDGDDLPQRPTRTRAGRTEREEPESRAPSRARTTASRARSTGSTRGKGDDDFADDDIPF